MAKRTVPLTSASANTGAPSTAGTPACFSVTGDQEPFHGAEQQVRLSSEENSSSGNQLVVPVLLSTTTKSPEEAREWSFLCPFCCSAELVNPVELHSPIEDKNTGAGARHCLACRNCVEQWCAAMGVLGDSASSSRSASSEDAFVCFDRLSLTSPCLTCPLCGCNIPTFNATTDSTFLREDARAMLRQPEMVQNCYTGIAPQSGNKSGSDLSSAEKSQSISSTATLYCGVCEEQKTTCVCVQCNFGLCDACYKTTHSRGKFKQHEVVGLDQARRRDQQKCREHAGMALDLYCETCATCVCVTCCFGGAHRGHDVFPLADVARRTADQLKCKAQVLVTTREKASAARTDLAALWPQYDSKVRAVESDIQRCFSSLRRILQEREDALLSKLSTASADVKGRATRLQSAVAALVDVLAETSAHLSTFDETVSPATLMRAAPQLLAQQAWALRMATQLTEEAATTVDGWRYQLGEEGVNGCRMACFDVLNTQIPNECGILQYQQVLADLGRLDVSTELQPPTVRTSGVDSERSEDNVEVEEDDNNDVQHSQRGKGQEFANVEMSVVSPVVEPQPESPPSPQKRLNGRSTSPAPALDSTIAATFKSNESEVQLAANTVGGDVPRLRPSHVSDAAVRLPPYKSPSLSSANCSSEMRLTSCAAMSNSGDNDSGTVGFPRVSALRSVTSARPSLPRSLVIGSSREEMPCSISTGSRTTLQVRAALDVLERKDARLDPVSSFASYAHNANTNSVRLRSDDAAHLARDTMPFRVSVPRKRVLSLDRNDENNAINSISHGGCGASLYTSLSWRALKLHRGSTAQDTASEGFAVRTSSLPDATGGAVAPSSAWQPSSSTRLSVFSEFEMNKLTKSNGVSPVRGHNGDGATEEHFGTVRRKTTGLQLEL